MRLYRTFHPQRLDLQASLPATVELSAESFHHLCKVLRLKEGEEIHLVDNSGGHYKGTLSQVAKKSATVELVAYEVATNESPLQLHLVQAISRNEKMDLTIQKAVELGVTEITPCFSERCGVSLSGERLQKKIEHWQNIIISACLQSYRDTIPKLNPPLTLESYLATLEPSAEEVLINLYPFAGQRLKDLAQGENSLTKASLLIGPEGGLSEQEVVQALEAGYRNFNLGPRVLRTETAGLTALAIIQATLGDI